MNNAPLHNLVQSNEIIELLKNKAAQDFLTLHFTEKPDHLSLTYSGKVDFDLTKLTQILHLYQKAATKIPLWVQNMCAMHAKSYAQCSHWEVARFKSTLFKGTHLLDLTAGLGVDSFYFSKSFSQITSVERDLETHQYAVYNANKLGVTNINFIQQDLKSFQFSGRYDVIYLDPDRRVNQKFQQKDLASYSPNILEWHEILLKRCDHLLIKLSPMLDITFLETALPKLSNTYVIGYKNEVKEILIHLTNKEVDKPIRHAVDINDLVSTVYTSERTTLPNTTQINGQYLLEPSKALIKTGLANTYCKKLGLHPTHQQGLYFISDDLIEDFTGRVFKIISKLECNWKQIKKYLKSQGLSSIQITQRHFFDDVKTIRKKLKIKEGGNTFLQFTIDENGNALCYYTKLCL